MFISFIETNIEDIEIYYFNIVCTRSLKQEKAVSVKN